jgi:Spy/CpxP family protein refolding chaperone
MKKTIMAVLVLTLFLTVTVLGQEEPAKQPAAKQPTPGVGMMMRHQGGPGNGPMQLPGLTQDQKSKLADLRLAHQKDILPLRTQLEKLHGDLKLEITADKFNEGKVKSIQSDMAKIRSEIGSKAVLHQRAIRDLLTPDQRKVFDQRILSRGMMGAGRGLGVGPGNRMGPGRGMGMGPGRMMGPGGKMGSGKMMGAGCCQGACTCNQ